MRLTDEEIRGRAVIGSDGLAIGDVTKISFDTATWQVTSIGLKLRKEIAQRLGVSSTLFRGASITIPIRMVQSVSDAILLTVPVGDLRSLLATEQGQALH